MLVTMDRNTRYYVNQNGGGGKVGPVCRASFRVKWGNVIGTFFRELFVLLNLCCIEELRLSESGVENRFKYNN